ncbi:nucleoporin [Burkholderia territorii]|uniref:nucleoporin FG repeat-containing protein n=1 Tax=Burkholderia territorii TaxID=1503055 RepID=UPI000B0A1867|nr:nucleoporin [Burkholderia territorii]
MPATTPTPVKKLKLDLANYRTLRQSDERHAIEAIIAINPDWFWALTESLLETGYLPTENILVQKGSGARPSLVVKEGNRRISALKLIHGLIPVDGLPIPQNILDRIENISASWKRENSNVPCAIYEPEEAETVNRIRSLTHGKGEKAGRDGWTAVARARHNRDENGASEPALDLLEKYLEHGKNHTDTQAQRWAGDYPLSVLEEAAKRIATRVGAVNGPDLAKKYPKIKQRTEFDNIIRDIGLSIVRFDSLRHRDIAGEYGIAPDPTQAATDTTLSGKNGQSKGTASGSNGPGSSAGATGTGASTGNGPASGSKGRAAAAAGGKNVVAVAVHDPRQVARTLKKFAPRGINREKLASLLIEIKLLKLDKNPIAFCFLLRSMFEISAKAYCLDHKADGLSVTKKGIDKPLVEVLRDITRHLTEDRKDKEMVRELHGAMAEIAKPEGMLSVTSMNQLVHNPKFSHQPTDIAILFGNIFPLLDAMNRP